MSVDCVRHDPPRRCHYHLYAHTRLETMCVHVRRTRREWDSCGRSLDYAVSAVLPRADCEGVVEVSAQTPD